MSRDSLKHRAAIRGLLDDVAAEMKFAVQDIRQEVVERGWFGRETTPEFTQSVDRLSGAERELAGPRDHSVDPDHSRDFTAEPGWDRWAAALREHAKTPQDREREAAWEAHKIHAEDLYGREPDRGVDRDEQERDR